MIAEPGAETAANAAENTVADIPAARAVAEKEMAEQEVAAESEETKESERQTDLAASRNR